MNKKPLHIGFISTRFSGTDGVSLEAKKWADVLSNEFGHLCFYFSGKSDYPKEQSMIEPLAYYRHPEIKQKHDAFFSSEQRKAEDTFWLFEVKNTIKNKLLEFNRRFDINIWIIENALAIPLHIPLGWAITEIVAETGIPTIAHHHDFSWERKRFLINCIEDYIDMSFPPTLEAIQHVVINSHAHHELARRRGTNAMLIPNVMNYLEQPPGADEYNSDLRHTLGVKDDELFILQPTRIIERKGIEHAIELVQRLGRKAQLVISHASGDEGDDYARRINQYAELLGVSIICADKYFDQERGRTDDGHKIYSISDAYTQADLVTYPSEFEGFGNAFLEAVYFRKPIVVNNYSIYSTDIKPKGFKVIEFDNFVTDKTIADTISLLNNKQQIEDWTGINFQLAKRYFSYEILKAKLSILLANAIGVNGVVPISLRKTKSLINTLESK